MKQCPRQQPYGMLVPQAAPVSPTPTYSSSTTMESTPSPSHSTGSYSSCEADDEGVREFKSDFDINRERGAHKRALALLHVTVASDADQQTGHTSSYELRQVAIREHEKKSRDLGSHMRALALLNATVGTDDSSIQPAHEEIDHSGVTGTSSHELRQAAIRAYKQKKREGGGTKATPTLVPPSRKELMATSNFTPKVKKPEEDCNSDTVEDMKCQYDLDREKEAKSKALRLLRQGLLS